MRYTESSSIYDLRDFTFDETEHLLPLQFCWTVGPEGHVYAVHERDRYAISVYRPSGTLQRVIERDCEPIARPRSEQRRLEKVIRSAMERQRPDFAAPWLASANPTRNSLRLPAEATSGPNPEAARS